MDYLNDITTQFIRDRIKETSFENRAYIKSLYRCERILIKHGPHSFAEAMLFKTLKDEYPVEYECIKKELELGVVTSPQQFSKLCREWENLNFREQIEQFEQKMKDETHALSAWFKAGGK